MSDPSPDKAKISSKKGRGKRRLKKKTQKAFDAYSKLSGSKDGKLKCDSVHQWIKNAGNSGVSEDDVKDFEKDGGLHLNEFKQLIEKLATKDKKQEKGHILKKLSSAMPSGGATTDKRGDIKAEMDVINAKMEDINAKLDDIKAKLGGEKK